MCVHFWLAPNLFEEQIQSRVRPFSVNPFWQSFTLRLLL
jgi:hypothetical protein